MRTDHYLTIIEDDRYRQAELLLNRRISTSARRLSGRLESIRKQLDLDWSSLLRSHREIQRLCNRNHSQPSIWDYWEEMAHPRSTPLFEAAALAIDEEIPHFADAIQRFGQTTRRLDSADPAVTAFSIDQALESARRASMDPTELNQIGQRWQKRLHRTAIRKAAGQIIKSETSSTQTVIIQAEMELLSSAPWAHMDRLLMAFEFTHSDIRTHLRDQLDHLATAGAKPSKRTSELGAL